jgi:hypothetical protein
VDKEKTMKRTFAGWMYYIGLVAMLAGGAPAASSAPAAAPGQSVSLVTDTAQYANAVLTDGQLTLSLEATVGADGTRSISVKRADGTLFYFVVMDAQHTPLYKQYGTVAVSGEDYQKGLSSETVTAMEDVLTSPEATLVAGFHYLVEMNTPHQALAELVGFASAVESRILEPVPESAESAKPPCVFGYECCGSHCDCHGHKKRTCVPNDKFCCEGGANADCHWWSTPTCYICRAHDRCVHNCGEHRGSCNCVF